jgi:hypothetical protein
VKIWKEAAITYFVRLRQTTNKLNNHKSIEIRIPYLQTVSEKHLHYTNLPKYLTHQKPSGRYKHSSCQRTATLSKDIIYCEEQYKKNLRRYQILEQTFI